MLPLPPTVSPEARAAAARADNAPHRWPMWSWLTRRQQAKGAAERREAVESLARERDVEVRRDADGLVMVPREARTADEPGAPWVLWIHGGGFCWGSAYDGSAVTLAADTGVPVVSVEYPLAPQHPYPAALDACVAAYRRHVAERGPRVLLGGLSAGANLAIGVLARMRAEGLATDHEPVGLLAATPFADLAGQGDSYTANEGRDAYVRWRGQQETFSRAYRGDAPADDPFVSPVHLAWDRPVPPTLITTGTRDLFLSDAVRVAAAMRSGGGEVDLRVWEGMWHAFQNDDSMPEARDCLEVTAAFVRRVLDLPA